MNLLSTDRELTRNSFYAASVRREPAFPPLQDEVSCDVAVVGGGLAGLSAAIELAERSFKVVLLEAREVGWGASGRNGGQAIHGLACEQSTIEAQLGLEASRAVWGMTLEALDIIKQRCQQHQIDCDWQDGYLGLAINARKASALQDWAEQMASRYDYPLRWLGPTDLPEYINSPRFHSGVYDPRSGHLHPLKYSLGLARAAAGLGVQMYEQTAVTRVERGATNTLHTARGKVRAKQVLLAGNVYLQDLAPALAERIMPVGTYIVCTEPLAPGVMQQLIPSRAAVCDTNFVLDYFRPTADDRLLYGGRVSYSTVTPPNLAQSMRARMGKSFPQLDDVTLEYSWGGFVDITMNRAPDFGRLDQRSGNPADAGIYYLQGFSGHGLALTGLAGRLVAEAIAGDAGRFDTFARLTHHRFPGGRWLRTPALVLGMAYYRLRDML
ncbi:MAG: FAD-binding oxidoreductase [Burkholderiaceae bacterium]|nr:FAD-binding oxidoreductase [Burkholderiaceae bacterium]